MFRGVEQVSRLTILVTLLTSMTLRSQFAQGEERRFVSDVEACFASIDEAVQNGGAVSGGNLRAVIRSVEERLPRDIRSILKAAGVKFVPFDQLYAIRFNDDGEAVYDSFTNSITDVLPGIMGCQKVSGGLVLEKLEDSLYLSAGLQSNQQALGYFNSIGLSDSYFVKRGLLYMLVVSSAGGDIGRIDWNAVLVKPVVKKWERALRE